MDEEEIRKELKGQEHLHREFSRRGVDDGNRTERKGQSKIL